MATAADCFRVQPGSSVVLRGVIEYKYEPPPSRAFSIFLTLSPPICIEGLLNNGSPFKNESLTSIQLGIPPNLNKGLRSGEHVALRGELWGPAVNEKGATVTFALKEVLKMPNISLNPDASPAALTRRPLGAG